MENVLIELARQGLNVINCFIRDCDITNFSFWIVSHIAKIWDFEVSPIFEFVQMSAFAVIVPIMCDENRKLSGRWQAEHEEHNQLDQSLFALCLLSDAYVVTR